MADRKNDRGPGAARRTAAYPLGPLMDGAGVNITVLSYADSVDFGIIACGRAVPQVGDIALGFGAAIGRLRRIALENTAESSPAARAAPSDPASVSAGKN